MCSVGSMKNCCKAKVPNLDLSKMAIHKNIVTLEVSVDDRGVVAMQINKACEYLARPNLYGSDVYSSILLPFSHTNNPASKQTYLGIEDTSQIQELNWKVNLPSEGTRSEHLSDEIESGVLNINPRSIELDDGIMVEGA
nr:hypothetical protein Iba_chr08eCG6290 [Ipomoea batatas]